MKKDAYRKRNGKMRERDRELVRQMKRVSWKVIYRKMYI